MQSDDDPDWSDFGLFIGADGLRATDAPWRLKDHGPSGPLSGEQIDGLAKSYGLEPSAVAELSRRLGYVLNPNQNIHVVAASRQNGRKVALAHLQDAAKQLDLMMSRLGVISERLGSLAMETDNGYEHSPAYSQMLDRLEATLQSLTECQPELAEFLRQPERFLKLEPSDKRQLYDQRRNEVLGSVFQTWVDAGRKLSFTTDPVTSKRSGALVEFSQEVCLLLTDPPTLISGETIAKLISKKAKYYRPMSEWVSVLKAPEE